MKRASFLLVGLVAVLVVAGFAIFGHGAGGSDIPASAAATSAAHAEGPAVTVLETLAVKGRAPKTGYDRVRDFGQAWLDVDHNGCDSRNDVLARDLSAIERPSGCRVLSGILVSPYTGETIRFVRGQGTSELVQIDHVVALSDAWQTGAQKLTTSRREALANDPLELLAVDGRSNSQKSDADAASWLPASTSYRCEYVARQIAVKAKYGLWVTRAEKAAMVSVLGSCPGQKVPTQ